MYRFRYGNVDPVLRSLVTNGCGSKAGFLNPPEFLFHASCDRHDWSYWVGGVEEDRAFADRGFYRAMLVDVENYSGPWHRRAAMRFTAWLYFRAVRRFGGQFFGYGEQRTMEDLIEVAQAARGAYGAKVTHINDALSRTP